MKDWSVYWEGIWMGLVTAETAEGAIRIEQAEFPQIDARVGEWTAVEVNLAGYPPSGG
jgi:hypothetical protein